MLILRPEVEGVGCNTGDTDASPERSFRPAVRLAPARCAIRRFITVYSTYETFSGMFWCGQAWKLMAGNVAILLIERYA